MGAAAAVALTSSGQAQPEPSTVDARIEIVWPHGGADVLSADKANITVYLFERGTLNAFCAASLVSLRRVSDNETPSLSITLHGTRRRVTQGDLAFDAWDFNNIDVSPARDPANRLYFLAGPVWKAGRLQSGENPTLEADTNVWAHAADALTLLPLPKVPTGVAEPPGNVSVEPRIQIVWPHDGAGRQADVTSASAVNLTAAVFHRNTLVSAHPELFHPQLPPRLLKALNGEPLRVAALGQMRLVSAEWGTYPVWDFNNIDVSAAKDPRNRYLFQVASPRGGTLSNIWVHGADGRTYFPEVDVPERGCP